MPEVLVVADDLTGAADCGSSFAAHGFATTVTLGEVAALPDVDVLALDADTRARSAEEAAAGTARLVARHAPSCRTVFKKIDSTLRGHVGVEVAAAFHALPSWRHSGLLVFTPAFPALGRTVRGGRLFVRGVPLEDTDLGRASPRAGPAELPRLLADVGLRTAGIGLEALRSGPHRLSAVMASRAHGCEALACDAETEEDLRAIVGAARSLERPLVWAGSAGLARPLAEALSEGRPRLAPVPPPAPAGPILFVVGSPSTESRAQVTVLAAAPDVRLLAAPADASATDEVGARLSAALASGGDVVLALAGPRATGTADERALAAALGRAVAAGGRRASALVLTGGDTARAVLRALDVLALRLAGEVEPGVPWSASEGGLRVPVITKAGAFGDRETLIRCRQALKKEPRERVEDAPA